MYESLRVLTMEGILLLRFLFDFADDDLLPFTFLSRLVTAFGAFEVLGIIVGDASDVLAVEANVPEAPSAVVVDDLATDPRDFFPSFLPPGSVFAFGTFDVLRLVGDDVPDVLGAEANAPEVRSANLAVGFASDVSDDVLAARLNALEGFGADPEEGLAREVLETRADSFEAVKPKPFEDLEVSRLFLF